MAGGKETPRQKLIGLMYLVLLALLALQVGAEIMVKFQQLNDSLQNFVDESSEKRSDIFAKITGVVNGKGGERYKPVLDESQEIVTKTVELIEAITAVKATLVEKTGGVDPETKQYMGVKDTDETSALLIGIGDKTDGKAYELKKLMDAYIEFLNKKVDDVKVHNPGSNLNKFHGIALDGKDDPLFKDDKDKRTYDFAHLNFDHTPMIASLAFLTEKQAKIASYANLILGEYQAAVGAKDFKFDKVFPLVMPQSNVVAAGTEYAAEMFIGASASGLNPVMTARGSALNVDPLGRGQIKFKASATFGKDEFKKEMSWTGTIKIPKPTGGGDTTFSINQKYEVTKPVLQVQSASVSALYKNCGNKLKVLCPALGETYNPSFTGTNASFVKGHAAGEITIVPTNGQDVTLNVSNDGASIGSESFKVRDIPIPDIIVIDGKTRSPVDMKNGVKSVPPSMYLQVIPDASFESFLPDDAKFYVTQAEFQVVKGRRPVGKEEISGKNKISRGKMYSNSANLKKYGNSGGNRILVEVINVERENYKGDMERVKLPVNKRIFNIPVGDD